MYSVIPSRAFSRALHKLRQSGKFKEAKLQEALELLKTGKPLPSYYEDHQLLGHLKNHRECHLAGNILLLYKRNEELHIITLSDIGTHHQIFGS